LQAHKNSYVNRFTAQQCIADVSTNIQLVKNIKFLLYFKPVGYKLEQTLLCNILILSRDAMLPIRVESVGMFVDWHLTTSDISNSFISLCFFTGNKKSEAYILLWPCRLLQFLNHRLIYCPIFGPSVSNAWVFWMWHWCRLV